MLKVAAIVSLMSIATSAATAEPLDKPVIGPKLICFKYSTFSLADGESITASYVSAEGISVTVDRPLGGLEIGESEIFASPKGPKRLVYSNGETTVYRVSDHGGRYALYGPTSFSNGKSRLLIWLSGDGLKGRKGDRAVYARFRVRTPSGLKCGQTFTYSWGF